MANDMDNQMQVEVIYHPAVTGGSGVRCDVISISLWHLHVRLSAALKSRGIVELVIGNFPSSFEQ